MILKKDMRMRVNFFSFFAFFIIHFFIFFALLSFENKHAMMQMMEPWQVG
jgi:hypothetical protein